MLSHRDNYSFVVIDELQLYVYIYIYIYINIKVGMHQSCREATGCGLVGIGKEERRFCPDDAMS